MPQERARRERALTAADLPPILGRERAARCVTKPLLTPRRGPEEAYHPLTRVMRATIGDLDCRTTASA